MALADGEARITRPVGTKPVPAPRPAARPTRDRRQNDHGTISAVPPADTYGVTDRRQVMRRDAVFRRTLVAADAFAAMLALAVGLAIVGTGPKSAGLLAAPAVVLVAKLIGLYERDGVVLSRSTLDEVPTLLQLSAVSALVVWLLQGVLTSTPADRSDLLVLWGCIAAAVTVCRGAVRIVTRIAVADERCLLVGDEGLRERLAEKLPTRRAKLVGFVPLAERRAMPRGSGHPEPYAALEHVLERLDAHRVIVAPGSADTDLVLNIVSRAKAAGVHVSIVPRLLEAVGSSVEFDEVEGMTMLSVHRFGLPRSSRFVKRVTDVIGGGIILVLAAPLMAAIAALIKLDSPGPVLFRQVRVGRNGAPFLMTKFRSMYDGADQRRAELAAFNDAGHGMFKIHGDPRITRVGRIIRRYSLDELPQLFNVLRGEMSLVGPRPLVIEEDQRVEGWHRRRLHLTPGMTGPWQVLGSTRVPLQDMVSIDYLYAANWSLWTDAKVLARTVGHVCAGRGL
jgi:exopolysaccharide biosynthesis polyprenyl glycosylphosphotransferase